MVMIDETQDFDMLMLRMLLDDTTIPKIFVGDPRQSIYQWRGCINGFNHMPESSLIIEFYSTFRVGDPACETIREKFDDCWMISKSKNITNIISDINIIGDEKYTYLFRTWRLLLSTASLMPDIWINNYHTKIQDIRRKHAILSKNKLAFESDEFEDDLPKFLKSISQEDLDGMIEKIEANMVEEKDAKCKMYTIHGYKGLEDDNIRIANDIEMELPTSISNMFGISQEDKNRAIEEANNILYVALTRGMKNIIMDNISIIRPVTELNTINDFIIRSEIPFTNIKQNEYVAPIKINQIGNGVQTNILDYFKYK